MASITSFGSGSGEWSLLDEEGATAVTFTSFVDIDVSSEGEALTCPVEEGAFANYNKVSSPVEIKLTLATQGDDSDFEDILEQLEEYKTEAVKLQVSTPSYLYESMTLESYSYKRKFDAGAGMLAVELGLIEVREVESQTTQVSTGSGTSGASETSTPKNATSSDTKDTGKTQTQDSEVKQSKALKLKNKVTGKS